jgi:hypothetical protein
MDAHSHLLTPTTAPKFILGGKAIFTIKSVKTGTRFTFRVQKAKKQNSTKETYFCSLLNGPQNTSDYKFFGSIIKDTITGRIQFFYSQKANRINSDAPSVIAFDHVINKLIALNRYSSQLEVWHEGRCARCGRVLTVPESIESGIGPECARHF